MKAVLEDMPAGTRVRSTVASLGTRLLHSRGGWALADQSVLSLGNFLSNLLLARGLPREQFGQFAFVLAIIQLLNNLHGALIGYQLTIRGAPATDGELRRLTSAALWLTVLLQTIGALVLAWTLWSVGYLALLPISIAVLSAWQFQETARRGLLAKLRYRAAVPGDAISFLGQVVLMLLLSRLGLLTVHTALLANVCSSLTAMVVQLIQVRVARVPVQDLTESLRQGWYLGRWLLLANVVGVLVVPIVPWSLTYFHGAQEVAGFRALATVLGISHPIIFSVSNIIVPAAAQADRKGGRRSAEKISRRYVLQGAALLAPYYLLLLVFPESVLRLLYGANSPYQHLGTELRLFVAFYTMYYFSQGLIALLNGLGNTASSFISQLATAVASLGITVPLIVHAGLRGVCWGSLAQGAASVGSAAWLWGRFRNSPPDRGNA